MGVGFGASSAFAVRSATGCRVPIPAISAPLEKPRDSKLHIRHGARADSGAAHTVERREAAGHDAGQILAVSGCLPVLAHRDERHVFPELLLQIDADPLLLLQIRRFEPGGAQFLDAGTVGPAVYRLLAVGADGQVAERMDVRQRAELYLLGPIGRSEAGRARTGCPLCARRVSPQSRRPGAHYRAADRYDLRRASLGRSLRRVAGRRLRLPGQGGVECGRCHRASVASCRDRPFG